MQHRDELQKTVPVIDAQCDNRPCIVCGGKDDHANTLVCDYCNLPCHLHDLDLALALSAGTGKGDKYREGYTAQGLRHAFLPSMLSLRFTAGVGVGIAGACGPPLVWRARKPLPSALRSSAALALGLARQRPRT